MTKERVLSPTEAEAQRIARVLDLQARGYNVAETARLLEISQSTVRRDLQRAQRRIPAEDAKQWRQVQLLRLERLMEACQSVLTANHVVVSNGVIVRETVLDDDGKVIWDPVLGPAGEQRTNSDGELLWQERKRPLLDHGAVLEAVAEMRKLEAEIAKLLGTQVQVKQAVELQHVNYTIEGVDMSKVIGAVKADQSNG